MIPKSKTPAVAYYRTSSATNVSKQPTADTAAKGTKDIREFKDSLPRQQDAVRAYAKAHKLEIVQEFYDAAVSGTDPVQSRDGFSAMLAYMLGNGARIVLVENASRFARDLVIQITGHDLLKSKGISLVPVDAPDYFTNETDTAKMVRNILGAVSQFEKDTLVTRLRKGRDRKSEALGRRIEGARWVQNQVRPSAAHVAAARAAKKRGLSLRKISAVLERKGFKNPNGKAYGAASIALMLRKPK